MSFGYEVRPFVPENRDSLEDLYRAVYGENWVQKTSLGWTLDHPMANGGAVVAVKDNVVVSAQPYCDFPLHTRWGVRGATLFLDVATHPAHQRRGLFMQVVTTATTAAFERGSSVIMTTPNRISFLGFQKLPGWIRLCSLDCMILPLGAGDPVVDGGPVISAARAGLALVSRFCKRPKPTDVACGRDNGIESPWLPRGDADVIWSRFSASMDNSIERNGDFLRWRFGPSYRLFLKRDSQGAGGYAAARVITRGGLKIGMILDCVVTNDEKSADLLIAHVITWLKEQGAAAAVAYFLERSTPWNQLRAAGFLPLPRFCAPRDYPVCVSVRPEDPQGTELLNPSRWHMSLADSDLA